MPTACASGCSPTPRTGRRARIRRGTAECRTLRLASERRADRPGQIRAAFAAANTALEARAARGGSSTRRSRAGIGGAGRHRRRAATFPGTRCGCRCPETPSDLCGRARRRAVRGARRPRAPARPARPLGRTRRCGSTDSRPGASRRTRGGLWVLERAGRLARLTGVPMPRHDAAARRLCARRLPSGSRELLAAGDAAARRGVVAGRRAADCPRGASGRGLAVLSWFADGEAAAAPARRRHRPPRPQPLVLSDARYAYALALARRRARRRAHAGQARRARRSPYPTEDTTAPAPRRDLSARRRGARTRRSPIA